MRNWRWPGNMALRPGHGCGPLWRHPPDLDLPMHERIEDPVFRRAVDLMDEGHVTGLAALLLVSTRT